jgi:hypothetical protein
MKKKINNSGYYADESGFIYNSNLEKCNIYFCKNGYARVNIKGKIKLVHRLVMLAFYGDSELCVNHKNGIKSDNSVVNLEYVTHKENTRHRFEVLKQNGANLGKFGKLSKSSKPIISIRISDNNKQQHEGLSDAARSLNMSAGNICSVLKGNIKQCNGYSFNYLNNAF